ncbi:sedoheptulokinase-like [Watersipora subatra]|uniref:sedoheptulokinase-like n=1 Tax=Watersipora subatra TaxID=2589382 RepID=UPI00355C011D
MNECYVGIDVGSSSVKVSVVEWSPSLRRLSTLNSCQKPYQDTRQSCNPMQHVMAERGSALCSTSLLNEQKAEVIINSINKCFHEAMHIRKERPASPLLVKKVAVCGQMHGVIMWSRGTKVVRCAKNTLEVTGPVSHLITWQDQRCSQEFLQSLPPSKQPLRAGFGCASLFWFAKHAPTYLEQFTHAGTIADFVVAMLCDLPAVVISDHNAYSWGYYDMDKVCWQTDVLDNTEFPIRLLPTIVSAGTVVGQTTLSWSALPPDVDVYVAAGDAQCSVKATQFLPHQAVLNLGTSCQLSFLSSSKVDEGKHLQRWPFKADNFISVLASMNGGNVLSTFVKMLHGWMSELDVDVSEASIWSKLSGMTCPVETRSGVLVRPILNSERGSEGSHQGASVSNIFADNISLAQVYQQVCTGLVKNVGDMLPQGALSRNGITEIKCCGSIFNRHPFFITAVKEVFPDMSRVSVCDDADAAYGAVLMVL